MPGTATPGCPRSGRGPGTADPSRQQYAVPETRHRKQLRDALHRADHAGFEPAQVVVHVLVLSRRAVTSAVPHPSGERHASTWLLALQLFCGDPQSSHRSLVETCRAKIFRTAEYLLRW